jgi:hypothetical protein
VYYAYKSNSHQWEPVALHPKMRELEKINEILKLEKR